MLNWIQTRIDSIIIGKPSYGINAAACKYKSGLPNYIRITDITNDGKYSKDDLAYVDNEQAINYYLKDNDIVFARTGASVGKSYLYNSSDGELVFAGFLIKISVDPEKADSRFVFAAVNTEQFRNWVLASSMRSGQPGINGGQYASYTFLLPPLPEQRAIARALSDVDGYIVALERLIAKKQNIKKGTMQELLKGKRRLPGFDGEWLTSDLPEILITNAGIKIGPFGSQLKKEFLINEGEFRVYGQENVYRNDFSFGNRYLTLDRFLSLQSCEIMPGDFLISTMGTVGKCAVVPSNICKGIMDSHLIRLRIDKSKLLAEYLLQLFSSDFNFLDEQTNRLSVGGIMDGLSTKIVSTLRIVYPKLIDEQMAIVEILSAMDVEINVLTTKLNKVRNIKIGMMQELLTGRIRLIQEDTDDAED